MVDKVSQKLRDMWCTFLANVIRSIGDMSEIRFEKNNELKLFSYDKTVIEWVFQDVVNLWSPSRNSFLVLGDCKFPVSLYPLCNCILSVLQFTDRCEKLSFIEIPYTILYRFYMNYIMISLDAVGYCVHWQRRSGLETNSWCLAGKQVPSRNTCKFPIIMVPLSKSKIMFNDNNFYVEYKTFHVLCALWL